MGDLDFFFKMGSIVRKNVRYAPMDRFHILGFPNLIPHADWFNYLPIFKDKIGEDVALHLIKFHMHLFTLGVDFHEDS